MPSSLMYAKPVGITRRTMPGLSGAEYCWNGHHQGWSVIYCTRILSHLMFLQNMVFDPWYNSESILTSSNGEYSFSTVCAASTAARAPAKSAHNIFDEAWKMQVLFDVYVQHVSCSSNGTIVLLSRPKNGRRGKVREIAITCPATTNKSWTGWRIRGKRERKE